MGVISEEGQIILFLSMVQSKIKNQKALLMILSKALKGGSSGTIHGTGTVIVTIVLFIAIHLP
jgi:hypothetical protein